VLSDNQQVVLIFTKYHFYRKHKTDAGRTNCGSVLVSIYGRMVSVQNNRKRDRNKRLYIAQRNIYCQSAIKKRQNRDGEDGGEVRITE